MSTLPAEALSRPLLADAAATSATRARIRLHSIDTLRGLVIVLMALDHVRDYFTNVRFDPLDLVQSDPALFMTRWITHLCAPTFIFLAGVSAHLVSRRMSRRELSWFLITRGVWLIALELTVVVIGWNFNLRYEGGFFLQVIWAIGASMIVLAGLVHLPRWAIATLAVVTIAGHNLLDGIRPETFGAWAPLWNLIHVQGETPFGLLMYPIIPWFAVMALGYCAGVVFELDEQRRRRILFAAGTTALLLFVVLRAINVYGDPYPWSSQPTAAATLMAFIKVHKYPPSLMYLLVTLGISTLLLGALEYARGALVDVLNTFGRVPMFFYLLHIYLVHSFAGLVALTLGYGPDVITNLYEHFPAGWGFGLPGVYVAWLIVVAALYPACKWFAEVKRRRSDWWLSYL